MSFHYCSERQQSIGLLSRLLSHVAIGCLSYGFFKEEESHGFRDFMPHVLHADRRGPP